VEEFEEAELRGEAPPRATIPNFKARAQEIMNYDWELDAAYLPTEVYQ